MDERETDIAGLLPARLTGDPPRPASAQDGVAHPWPGLHVPILNGLRAKALKTITRS